MADTVLLLCCRPQDDAYAGETLRRLAKYNVYFAGADRANHLADCWDPVSDPIWDAMEAVWMDAETRIDHILDGWSGERIIADIRCLWQLRMYRRMIGLHGHCPVSLVITGEQQLDAEAFHLISGANVWFPCATPQNSHVLAHAARSILEGRCPEIEVPRLSVPESHSWVNRWSLEF